ncbi:MAG: hypothetical protein JW791_03040 [Nanoarchaeota archaeon]|nr:hypothetical protein [Nanoarchaeota archaeon]
MRKAVILLSLMVLLAGCTQNQQQTGGDEMTCLDYCESQISSKCDDFAWQISGEYPDCVCDYTCGGELFTETDTFSILTASYDKGNVSFSLMNSGPDLALATISIKVTDSYGTLRGTDNDFSRLTIATGKTAVLKSDGWNLPSGVYSLTVTINGLTQTTSFNVQEAGVVNVPTPFSISSIECKSPDQVTLTIRNIGENQIADNVPITLTLSSIYGTVIGTKATVTTVVGAVEAGASETFTVKGGFGTMQAGTMYSVKLLIGVSSQITTCTAI